jgi:O-Antigen ligase
VSDRFLRITLAAFVVGLAAHNLAMAGLWDLGIRGAALDVVAAWKETLLAVALVVALWTTRRLPLGTWPDRLAVAYALVIVLYALIPQDWLGGDATTRGVLYALRHDLTPVAAYALGRLAGRAIHNRRAIIGTIAGTGVAVALLGLADVYLIPLQWWRDSGVPGWFAEQLGLVYSKGLSGLPENWVLNTGDEQHPLRRLTSTFLSPLATGYMLVVVLLLLLAVRRPRWWQVACLIVCSVGLLFTHTRAALVGLAAGLVVLAFLQRRIVLVGLAVAVIVVGVGFVRVFPHIGPETSYTQAELDVLREHAAQNPGAATDPLSPGEASAASHLRNLRDGIETVLRHPQGFGLGNAGVTAARTKVKIQAGESTYTEVGVEAGLLGMLLFLAWNVALVLRLGRREAGLAAVLVAVLVLGLQTDVIGVHWLAVVVWALAGAAVTNGEEGDGERSRTQSNALG